MSERTWRMTHHLMEHALKTLSGFELRLDPAPDNDFEATELPLLIADLQEGLSELYRTLTDMEAKSDAQGPDEQGPASPVTAHPLNLTI